MIGYFVSIFGQMLLLTFVVAGFLSIISSIAGKRVLQNAAVATAMFFVGWILLQSFGCARLHFTVEARHPASSAVSR